MKKLFSILLVLIPLLLLTSCVSIPVTEEGLVIGQSYQLESGETLHNDLTVIGGNASLEDDSTVEGDVAVMGGTLNINGTVNGEVTVLGGYVYLDEHAHVRGSVNALGGTIERSSKAVVEGSDNVPTNPRPRITTMRTPNMQISFDPITGPLMAIFQALALAALAVLATLTLPAYLERTGRAAVAQPYGTGGVGCLTILVLVVMTITIILIPFSVVGFVVAAVAALFGWLALGLVLGRYIAVWLKQTWTDPVSAGVGTMSLSLLVSLLNVIPCIGWFFYMAAGMVALGAVVLTRFGTQEYPAPYTPAGPVVPPVNPVIVQPDAPASGAQVYDAPATGAGEENRPDELG